MVAPDGLASSDGVTNNSTTAGVVLLQVAFTSSITHRFTGTPEVVVVGAVRKFWKVRHSFVHIVASYGKFASTETVGTGFALVLATCTRAAAIPWAAFGASAVI